MQILFYYISGCQNTQLAVIHPLLEKPNFLFPNVLKRWSFQKNPRWNMIFLVLSGKMIFLFPKNIILFFRRKMKDDLSQKNTWKYDIFFKCSEKMVLPKTNCTGIWFFLYHEEKWHFFFPKPYFFYRRKMKDDLSQKINGNMMFSVCW